jgi:hypothetical protein
MPIIVSCACGQKLRAKDDKVGHSFHCPACGALVTVPWPDSSPRTPEEPPPDLPPQIKANTEASLPAAFTPHTSRLPAVPTERVPLIVSAIAIVLSLCCIIYTTLHDPLGAGLSSYDFTTPQNALQSQLQIDANSDLRAAIELQRAKNGRAEQEKRDTVKVHRESSYEGKKILFISYNENGLPKHEIAAFEKDAETGFWFPGYVSTYKMNDSALESAIDEWKSTVEE